jgi:molybdopterin synthase catalytic subunit
MTPPRIEVEVLFFARARELTGTSDLKLTLPPGATVRTAAQSLNEKFPALEDFLRCCRLALNEEFTTGDEPVPENSVLAVIPPVSGG